MPRLLAARFESIGHRDARLGGVTLRFTDDKGPCDSVIWLRNGGGKSSILNLLFSLLRPSQREFLGSEAEAKLRELTNYVAADDVGTVCLAWQLDGDIQLLTGVCMELQRAGAGAKLQRLFYAIRIDEPERARISIDSLPISRHDGGRARLLRQADLREALLALDGVDGVHVTTTKTQHEWEDVLDSFGLDPEVFGYQLRMNRREGAADELFRFDSVHEFADFLLEMVLQPQELKQVSDNLRELRASIQRRPRLEHERNALERARAEIHPVVALAEQRQQAVHSLEATTSALADLRSTLAATEYDREAAVQTAVAEQERQKKRHQEATQLLRRSIAERGLFGRRKVQLANDEAKRVWQRVEDHWKRVERQSARLRVGEVLREAREAELTRSALAAALAAKLDEHRPLLLRMRAAAGIFLGALQTHLATLSGRLELVDREIARVEKRRVEIGEARERLHAEQAESETRRNNILEQIARLAAARARLVERGALLDRESASAAVARHGRAIAELDAQDRAAEAQRVALSAEAARHEERLAEAERRKHAEQREHDRAKSALERAERLLTELQADAVLQQVLEDSSPDLEHLAADAVTRLAARSVKLSEELIALGIDDRGAERVLNSLEQHELLPPPLDAERVQRALRASGISAFTGGAYLADNARGEAARARAAEHPDLAAGVVVAVDDVEQARALISVSAIDVEAPVAVGPTAALLEVGRPGLAVLPPDAYYDRQAALGERERRREQSFRRRERLEALDQLKRQVDELSVRLGAFVAEYPNGWLEAQRGRIAALERTVASLTEQSEEETAHIAGLNQQIDGLKAEETKRAETRTTRLRSIALVEELQAGGGDEIASLEENAERYAGRLRGLPVELAGFDEERMECADELERLRKQRDGVRDEAQLLEREANQVRVDADAAVHAEIPLSEARVQYQTLARTYADKTGNDLLRKQIDDARERTAQLERKLQERLAAAQLTREEVALAVEEAERTVGIATETERVARRLDRLSGERAEAKVACENAAKELSAATEALADLRRKGNGPLIDEIEHTTVALEPSDLEAAILATTRNADEARQTESDAQRRRDEAGEAAKAAADAVKLAQSLVARIDDVLASEKRSLATAEPLSDLTDIDRHVGASVKAVREATRELARLNDEAGKRARALTAFATHADQAVLPPLIRERLSEPDIDLLLERAPDHLQDVETRIQSVTRELEDVERHRRIVATSLLRATDPALRLLRKLQPASVFPPSVAMWGGEPFIEVQLQTPSAGESEMLAAGLVSEMIEPGPNGKLAEVPSGIKLVQQMVRRLVGTDRLRITILKPEVRRRILREPIEKLGSFSRGEQLTAAILLYCTLARLRAQERGRKAPTSVLILDNPLGTCSQPVLVELQRSMAAAHQVQLIYTTGIEDLEALARLPRIIRLRNAHIDVHGRLHVTVDDTPMRTAQIALREEQ